jgi:hypothetical protein
VRNHVRASVCVCVCEHECACACVCVWAPRACQVRELRTCEMTIAIAAETVVVVVVVVIVVVVVMVVEVIVVMVCVCGLGRGGGVPREMPSQSETHTSQDPPAFSPNGAIAHDPPAPQRGPTETRQEAQPEGVTESLSFPRRARATG